MKYIMGTDSFIHIQTVSWLRFSSEYLCYKLFIMKIIAFAFIYITLYIIVQSRRTDVDKISDIRKEHEFTKEMMQYILGNNDTDMIDNMFVKKIEAEHRNPRETWQGSNKHFEKFINFLKWFSSGFINIFKNIKNLASKL